MTNRLVIDKVASLLADPQKWDELFNVIDTIPLDFFTKDSKEWIQLDYVRALRNYVRDKIKLSKATRQAYHYDYPDSVQYYTSMSHAEKELKESTSVKLQARQRMIDASLDYKQYHNNITTRFF